MSASTYRYGDSNPVSVPFKSGSAVEIGDLCFLASDGTVQAAASMTAGASLSASQGTFAGAFLGVAQQRYDGSNAAAIGIKDGKLMIATDGVYDFPCASATFKVGDMVTADGSGSTFVLDSQQVVGTSTSADAIGVVVEAGTSLTTVRVRLFSNKIARSQF